MTGDKNGEQYEERAQAAKDRRQWERKPSDLAEITVVRDGGPQAAAVIDESFGGIGILLHEAANIVRGDQLKLLYRNVPVLGVVRRIELEPRGQHVGLEWLKTRRNDSPKARALRKRAANFLSFSGFCVVCHVDDERVNGTLHVTLPDGSKCDVKTTELLTRTCNERKHELENLSLDLTMLAGVYQLGEHPTKEERIEAILNFEFERKAKTQADFIEQIRSQNKTILDQSQRIDELESYLGCIVGLVAKVKELELELESAL
jgi:hypothetical protein